jgi:hypothetical protein
MDSFVSVGTSRANGDCELRLQSDSLASETDRVEKQVPIRCSRLEEHASETSSDDRARVWINVKAAYFHGLIRRFSLHYITHHRLV